MVTPLLSGCVERYLNIRSDPPGATIYVNGAEVGEAPVQHPFVWYGTYDIQARRDGHESVRREHAVSPPWYQVFPLDFFAELLWPFTLTDEHEIEVVLPRATRSMTADVETELKDAAEALRAAQP